jgi:hypothetical protein
MNEIEARRLLEIVRGAPKDTVAALAGASRDDVIGAVAWLRDNGTVDEAIALAALAAGSRRPIDEVLAEAYGEIA